MKNLNWNIYVHVRGLNPVCCSLDWKINKLFKLYLFQTSEWVFSASLFEFGSLGKFSILFLLLSQIRIFDKRLFW